MHRRKTISTSKKFLREQEGSGAHLVAFNQWSWISAVRQDGSMTGALGEISSI